MAKLLIVDDDLAVLQIMKEALQKGGFDVESAGKGEDAVLRLEAERYDLLITDILMPDIDGFEVIDLAVLKNPDIYVLAISGGGEGKDGADLLDAALTCGADAILQKPFSPEELVRTSQALLR